MLSEKSWYKSKLVWLGISEAAIGLGEAAADFAATGDFSSQGFAHLGFGVLTIFFRVITKVQIK